MKFIHAKTDGTLQVIPGEKDLELSELQKLVGGFVELTRHGAYGHEAYVNEEGRLRGFEENPNYPSFVGDVVICVKSACRFVDECPACNLLVSVGR